MDKKILIVDDMEVIRKALRMALYSAGEILPEQISEASNGKEALRMLMIKHFDLMFTDINMPDMNGLQLLKEMQEKKYKVPTVVLSTIAEKSKIVEAIKLGAVKYIIKPFNKENILEVVNTYLKK